MYIPEIFSMTDDHEKIKFMEQHNFATFIVQENGKMIASHLPCMVQKRMSDTGEEKLWLITHVAKGNELGGLTPDHPVLAVFMGPHAYISTKHYESKRSVPTWNYMAVHAYGSLNEVGEQEDKEQYMLETIKFFDLSYTDQWLGLPSTFKEHMMAGITMLEIMVTQTEGQWKLSQNKTLQEQNSIIRTLSTSSFPSAQLLAEYMNHYVSQHHEN